MSDYDDDFEEPPAPLPPPVLRHSFLQKLAHVLRLEVDEMLKINEKKDDPAVPILIESAESFVELKQNHSSTASIFGDLSKDKNRRTTIMIPKLDLCSSLKDYATRTGLSEHDLMQANPSVTFSSASLAFYQLPLCVLLDLLQQIFFEEQQNANRARIKEQNTAQTESTIKQTNESAAEIVYGGVLLRLSQYRNSGQNLHSSQAGRMIQRGTQLSNDTMRMRIVDKEKRTLQHAKEQLKRRSCYLKQLNGSVVRQKQNLKKDKVDGIVDDVSKAMALVKSVAKNAASLAVELEDCDEGKPEELIVNSLSVHNAAFCGPPDTLRVLIQKTAEKLRISDQELVNSPGYVQINRVSYGIKRVGQNYRLGYGSKAPPIHFACLAGRVEIVFALIEMGAKWRRDQSPSGLPTPYAIASSIKSQSILHLFQILHLEERGAHDRRGRPTPTKDSESLKEPGENQ